MTDEPKFPLENSASNGTNNLFNKFVTGTTETKFLTLNSCQTQT